MQLQPTHQLPDDHQLIEVLVSELTIPMIDWLVAREEGVPVSFDGEHIRHSPEPYTYEGYYSPSTDASIGHILLEREKIQLRYIDEPGHSLNGIWMAQDCRFRSTGSNVGWKVYGKSYADMEFGYLIGPTMLIAGLRFMIAKNRVGKYREPAVRVPASLVSSSRS